MEPLSRHLITRRPRTALPQANPIPRCPRFREVRVDGKYPIPGYCALATIPGQLMIPSMEEFRSACTTLQFRRCPWFGEPEGSAALGARPAACPDVPRDVWACPKVTWSRNAG